MSVFSRAGISAAWRPECLLKHSWVPCQDCTDPGPPCVCYRNFSWEQPLARPHQLSEGNPRAWAPAPRDIPKLPAASPQLGHVQAHQNRPGVWEPALGSEDRGSFRGLSPPGSAKLSEGAPRGPGQASQSLGSGEPTAAGESRGLEKGFWRAWTPPDPSSPSWSWSWQPALCEDGEQLGPEPPRTRILSAWQAAPQSLSHWRHQRGPPTQLGP